MNRFQRLCVGIVLSLVLTSATIAGEINTPGIAPPTPTPTPASHSAMIVGEMPHRSSTPEVSNSESTWLNNVTFHLLQIMLSVF